MKEIKVSLSTPIQYDYDGDKTDAEFVLIKKPTAKVISLTAIIRSIFQENLLQMSSGIDQETLEEAKEFVKKETKEQEGEDSLNWSEAVAILYRNHETVEKLTVTFMELMRQKNLFLLDGETKMTKPLIESLDEEDFEKIMGSFVANFTYASLKK